MKRSRLATFTLLTMSLLSGCCIGYRDVSRDPQIGKNFAEMLQGKCFRTIGDSVPLVGDIIVPEDTGFGPLRRSWKLSSGTRFRVTRLLENCGSDGGTRVEGVILDYPLEGETFDMHRFFEPPDPRGPQYFIIGPHVRPERQTSGKLD